jgi:hypothetical protein
VDTRFQFDDWAQLASVDPGAFEVWRRQVVDRFLEESSSRQRPLGVALQREIDYERKRAGDPQAAFLAVALMLCQQLAFLGDEMAVLGNDLKEAARGGLDADGSW